MSSLKQRKGAPPATPADHMHAHSSSSSSSSGSGSAVPVAALSGGHQYSTSAYDYDPRLKGSARDVAAARLASSRSSSGGLLAGFAGGSEFVFQAVILLAVCVLAFMVRLFSVVRYESVIHEFDPWFNFRTTRYLVEEGFYAFHNCKKKDKEKANRLLMGCSWMHSTMHMHVHSFLS